MTRTLTSMIAVAALLLALIGCGPESATTPTQTVSVGLEVSFDFSTPTSTIPDDQTIQTTELPDGGPDSVTISTGLLMLRSVRFNTEPVSQLDTTITAADEDNDVSDASVSYHGPGIVQIARNSTYLGNIDVPVGNYAQTTFVLQKARESDNLGIYDALLGSSLLVKGNVWHGHVGRAFVYETDYTAQLAIDGNFVISENSGSLVLRFAAGRWFHNGARWLDPNEPVNRSRILRCIQRNIGDGPDVD